MMTSELEALKTNEFQRRRKLRLQQVREQSKEIAKKIRQRAKAEKLRHIKNLDAKKSEEYFAHQEKLVKRLEELYVRGLKNIGTAHKNAELLNVQEEASSGKTDLSKSRGKEAAVVLRRNKQQQLDEQKRALDRKLQAREIANEISREKSSSVASKLTTKQSSSKSSVEVIKNDVATETVDLDSEKVDKEVQDEDNEVVTDNMDMQWESGPPPEWVPHVPALSLPKDDEHVVNITPKLSTRDTSPSARNLFAVSSDMPSSLRGGLARVPEETIIDKPSVTIVSEYIHARDLRLREPSITTTKKSSDDLLNIKQTIMQTRASSNEGIPDACFESNVCHVADVQVIPVPSWEAGISGTNCSNHALEEKSARTRPYKNVPNSHPINEIFSSVRPHVEHDLLPRPVLRGSSPFRRSKVPPNLLPGNKTTSEKPKASKPDNTKKHCSKLDSANTKRHNGKADSAITKKHSSKPDNAVTKRPSPIRTYNHSTRDVRNIPYSEKSIPIVTRDTVVEEDAYSLAMKESLSTGAVVGKDRGRQKVQVMRNRVAMNKAAVDKEYEETMAFLKSLPKDSRPIKTAYFDEKRQQAENERKQRLLQYEFKKIQKDCRKHSLVNRRRRSKSKSPTKLDSDDEHTCNDFQYSWMPVPDSDHNLVVHTIPTDVSGKGNTVKFADVDSYHEYRSRHKHTPPTKDTAGRKTTGTEGDCDSTDSSSCSISDSNSAINLSCDNKSKTRDESSSDERIIIYKILDSKMKNKTAAKNSKLLKKIAKSLSSSSKETIMKNARSSGEMSKDGRTARGKAEATESIDQLIEGVTGGIYKTVNVSQGPSYNVMSCYNTSIHLLQPSPDHTPWWDNMQTMPLMDNARVGDGEDVNQRSECSCRIVSNTNTGVQWVCGDESVTEKLHKKCKCNTTKQEPAPASSTVLSYKTAKEDRRSDNEAEKFYIGASGYLKDEDYEVIIQLRKKDLKEKKDENQTEIKSATVLDEKMSDTMHLQPLKPAETIQNVPLSNEGSSKVSNERIGSQEQGINTDTVSSDDVYNNTAFKGHKASVDRGVCTTSEGQLTAEVRSDNQRPATSTSTQTTLASPVHGPLFHHMCSSTSTTYMSPPESILPQYLRRDQQVNYVTIERDVRNEDIDRTDCEESCSCRHCEHSKKLVNKLATLRHACEKYNRSARHSSGSHTHLRAPPNTARSSTLGDYDAAHTNTPKSHISKSSSISSPVRRARTKKVDDSPSKTCSKPRKCKKIITPVKRSATSVARGTLSKNSTRKITKKIIDKQLDKVNLNPVVKVYVDQLLTLNNAGMKAVEVMAQDCSAVTTPGSSVIHVPRNIDDVATAVNDSENLAPKISLEQLKDALIESLIQQGTKAARADMPITSKKKSSVHFPTKKAAHKVKSLNISKNFFRMKSDETKDTDHGRSSEPSTSTSTTKDNKPTRNNRCTTSSEIRSRSIPSPRPRGNSVANDLKCKSNSSEMVSFLKLDKKYIQSEKDREVLQKTLRDTKQSQTQITSKSESTKKSQTRITSKRESKKKSLPGIPLPNVDSILRSMSPNTISTQTNVTKEFNLMKLAEGKLQNMETIADLTEKCTMRLSNLAKVLNEVRRSKSNHRCNQVSDSELDIGHRRGDLNRKRSSPICVSNTVQRSRDVDSKAGQTNTEHHEEVCKCTASEDIDSHEEEVNDRKVNVSENIIQETDNNKQKESLAPKVGNLSDRGTTYSMEYVSFLADIPKPKCKSPVSRAEAPIVRSPSIDPTSSKSRGKPPPALLRKSLKHTKDDVVPHELSTVVEVDSPLSIKLRSQSANNAEQERLQGVTVEKMRDSSTQHSQDQIQNTEKEEAKDSQNTSKAQMMDLKQFNDIMLKPFMTIEEYARQCNVDVEEGSKMDGLSRPADLIHDDVSSLHSENSLPDVIAELLKRNIISEPFKYDTESNVNSTTVSTESSLSVLALSKICLEQKPKATIEKTETSDTLSVSSNPDLENAFKKLGMGWASSTLKKTKERLALSSSSTTSGSSLSHFKFKTARGEIPVLVTDTVSSVVSLSRRKEAEQQTSHSKSMTVKQFLAKQLANKITFTNKSRGDETEEEFVSLFETKLPEGMKHSDMVEKSAESVRSVNARARTSTPVQLFKSVTYHSSSASNASNCLFSNADDLSSVKGTTSNSNNKNHSTSDKDDLTIPNYSLRMKRNTSDCSKSD